MKSHEDRIYELTFSHPLVTERFNGRVGAGWNISAKSYDQNKALMAFKGMTVRHPEKELCLEQSKLNFHQHWSRVRRFACRRLWTEQTMVA
jgi:hypothetical protein